MIDDPDEMIPMPAAAGQLGEDVEAHERHRLQTILDRSAVPVKATAPDTQVVAQAAAQRAVSVVMRQEMAGIRKAVADLQHDIQANTETLRMADVPLEQVADSHERATASFERLRSEIAQLEQHQQKRFDAIDSALASLMLEVQKGRA
jgi:Skp family chaperone for outer membrane proteins